MLEIVEVVAFRRLADYLLYHSGESARAKEVRAAHKAITADLGSSRVVIGRLMKDFEREELVAPSRSLIRLQDGDSLRLRAGRL